MINELFERELQNTSLNGVSLADYIKENYVPKKSGKWIPVSERLPEKNVEVLVTTEWESITIGEMFSSNNWFIHEGATKVDIDDIKAWMPLPEPYKAESEETETWNSIHAQITAPKGTFERIFNDADDDNDI